MKESQGKRVGFGSSDLLTHLHIIPLSSRRPYFTDGGRREPDSPSHPTTPPHQWRRAWLGWHWPHALPLRLELRPRRQVCLDLWPSPPPPTPKYILFLSLTSVRGRGLFCRVRFGLGCPDEVICFGMVVLNTYEVCANLQMNFGDRRACKIEADGGIRPPPCSMTFVALLHWWFNHHSYELMLMLYCVMYHKALDIVLCTRIIICCVTMKEVLCYVNRDVLLSVVMYWVCCLGYVMNKCC
jgi:hypothetical protein